MSIERFDVDHERYLGYPDPNGELCYYKDVAQLEASHAAVCAMLEKVVNSAKHTISPVYSAVTEEWRNDYEYRLPTEVIREARAYVRANQDQLRKEQGYE